jgi:hypothetical protein
MSVIQEGFAEELAKLFHHYHEALAPDFECKREDEARLSWELVPHNERKLMVATARLVLLELATSRGTVDCKKLHDVLKSSGGGDCNENPEDAGNRLGKEGRECGC